MAIKTSGIYLEIRGDSTQLRKDLTQAKKVVSSSAKEMSDAMGNALTSNKITSSTNKLIANLNNLSNGSKIAGSSFDSLGIDAKALDVNIGISEKQFASLQGRMLKTQAGKTQISSLKSISSAAGLTAKETAALGKQMGLTSKQIDIVNGANKKATVSTNLVGSALKGALAYMTVGTVVEFGKAVFDAGLQMDKLNYSYKAVFGSQQNVQVEFAYLRSEADRLGKSFYDLADPYKQIAAASKGTALEGEKTREIFSAITEASSALGMSADDTNGALNAISQMMSKGTIQAEELRGQLGERLPGAFQIMARALGVSTEELNKMLEKGEVIADDALPKLRDEIHKMYGAAAETAGLESGQAAVNKLSEAWRDLKTDLSDTESAVAGIKKITDVLKTVGEYANLRSISETMAEGAGLAKKGLIDFNEFTHASFLKRQKMVDDALAKERESYSKHYKKLGGADAFGGVPSVAIPTTTARPTPSSYDSTDKDAIKEQARILKIKLEAAISAGKARVAAEERANEDINAQRQKDLAAYQDKLEKEAGLEGEFWEKYAKQQMTESEYELAILDKNYEKYAKVVTDKNALDIWYATEKKSILDDVNEAEESSQNKWVEAYQAGLKEYEKDAGWTSDNVSKAMTDGMQGMEDALVEFVKTGKLSFSDLTDSIIEDLIRMQVQASITEPLSGLLSSAGSAIGGYFFGDQNVAGVGDVGPIIPKSAKGNVFSGAGISAYSGSVVDIPTFFSAQHSKAYANGGNVMGEAGPEAILPLTRGTDGKLGVESSSSGGQNVTVNVINQSDNEMTVTKQDQTFDAQGTIVTLWVDAFTRNKSGLRTMLGG